jgi:TPR repeat protein
MSVFRKGMNRGASLRRSSIVALIVACCATGTQLLAADRWIEVKSAHFSVVSNAGDRATRTLVWQLEQVRSATSTLWRWARLDLNVPLSVVIVKDENEMRRLAPEFWEKRGAVHPASIWLTGPDQHYLLLRADVELDERETVNPYLSSYASYIGLVLAQTGEHELPFWFSQGFTGVLSNTIVQEGSVLVGAPIPWYLQVLRERPLLPLAKLLAVTRQAPEVGDADRRHLFDAETWALVHFMMFGEERKHADKLNVYWRAISSGTDAAAAFAEAFGPLHAVETAFRRYIEQPIFTYQKINVDVSVQREKFPSRAMSESEAASVRALVLASMQRPQESRAAIAESRKADTSAPGSYVAEGLLLDFEGKADEARAAYAKAAAAGSTNAYAYYRLASLKWQRNPSRDALAEIEADLVSAVRLNPRYAAAYSWLGQVRASLGTGDPVSLVRRAIALEPKQPRHRMSAANVLLRQGKQEEARVEASAAATLARTEGERRAAQQLLELVAQAGPASERAETPPVPSTAAGASPSPPAGDMNALNSSCQAGDASACGSLLPLVETACGRKNGSACDLAGVLYEHGRGTAADAAKAAGFYDQACLAGERNGCIGLALLQARGSGVVKDPARAQATLGGLCDQDVGEACTELALLIVPEGRSADLTRARQLLSKGCDRKDTRACELLASLPQRK